MNGDHVCSTCDNILKGDYCKRSQSLWARVDNYGIYTGVYCDDCYDSEIYPYRKDDYFDPAFAGESLESI